MDDDYRQRCADAAMNAWNRQAVVCDHSQIIPFGNLVDAVLAVRDQDAETLRSDNEELRKRAEASEAEVARLRALLDGQEVTDDEDDEPGYVTAHLGELQPTTCPECGSDDLLAAKIYGLTTSSSRVMGEMAVCHGCGWSPYANPDDADLDLLQLVRDLADPGPCEDFDHHGQCQTHGWLQEGVCPHARARDILTAGENRG